MNTRSSHKKDPIVIEDSEVESISEFHSISSDCSSVESSEVSSNSEQEKEAFMNLLPAENEKKKKSKAGLRSLLTCQSTNSSNNFENFERAPILNLLRPVSKGSAEREYVDENQNSQNDFSSVPSPFLDGEDEEEEILEMSHPKKKPKLMDELEQSLNLPTEEYKTTGLIKELREQRKKENKKRDYLIEKQYKEYKMGKKKDNISNQVFNAIEDFFA